MLFVLKLDVNVLWNTHSSLYLIIFLQIICLICIWIECGVKSTWEGHWLSLDWWALMYPSILSSILETCFFILDAKFYTGFREECFIRFIFCLSCLSCSYATSAKVDQKQLFRGALQISSTFCIIIRQVVSARSELGADTGMLHSLRWSAKPINRFNPPSQLMQHVGYKF